MRAIVGGPILLLATPARADDATPIPSPSTIGVDLWTFLVPLLALAVVLGLWWKKVIGPKARFPRDPSGQPALLWILCALITLLSASFGSATAALLVRVPRLLELFGVGEEPKRALAMLGGGIVGIVVGALFARLIHQSAPAAGLAVRPSDLWRGGIAFALALPLVFTASIASTLVYRATQGAMPDTAGHEILKGLRDDPTNTWYWVMAASAILLAPVFEELVYRAFLQSAIRRATNRPALSIALASALFAAMHVVGGASVPWYAIPPIFVLGLAMGTAFEKTSRLGVPITMHVLFNALNVALTAAT